MIVSNGNGQKQTDEYDLTFGAVGPTGSDGADGAAGATGDAGADGADGDSCSLTECAAPGESTLTCGATSIIVPCEVGLLSCPCWNTYTESSLAATMNGFNPTDPYCLSDTVGATARQLGAVGFAEIPTITGDAGAFGRSCTMVVTGIRLFITELDVETSQVCKAEVEAVIPQITWCP